MSHVTLTGSTRTPAWLRLRCSWTGKGRSRSGARTTGPNRRVSNIVEVLSDRCVYAFDRLVERLVVAYGISSKPQLPRDRSRIRGFPDVNVGVRAVLGERAFLADRGHYLAHASGGDLDINLFPHRRDLNRGWKDDGRRFRQMERYVAAHPGTFFYHRPIYDDDSWIPNELEYGVLVDDVHWWVSAFKNKPAEGDPVTAAARLASLNRVQE